MGDFAGGPTPGPAGPAPGDTFSEATRYLSAGAYLDDAFADRVLKELFGQTFRAVAPSYGFDVGLVAAHCLAARRQRLIRDVGLVAVGIAMFLFGVVGLVLVGEFWWIAGWVISNLRNGTDGLRQAYQRISTRSLLTVFGIVVLTLLLQPLVFIWSALVGAAFGPLSPGDAFFQFYVRPFMVGVVGWAVLYGIMLWYLIARRQTVAGGLQLPAFRMQPRPRISLNARLQARLDAITWGQLGNVTVYSGFDPFVGAGDEFLPDWSFAIPLVAAPKHEGAVERFSVPELVAHVRGRFADIAGPGDGVDGASRSSEHPLPGLAVSDHVFVSGTAIHGDGRFLPERAAPPRTSLRSDEIQQILLDPHGPVRHYCAIRVSSWQGMVVTSTFLNFSTDGEKLYFECARRVLRPVRWEYHQVDAMQPLLSSSDIVDLVDQAAARTVGAVATAPFRLVADLGFERRDDGPVGQLMVDRGARLSVRELGAERDLRVWSRFHNYFQLRDARKHSKIVERHALEAIFEFLDANGIDTTEFSSQQTSIITNNTFNQSGETNVMGAVNTAAGGEASQSGTINAQPASKRGAAPS